MSKGISVVTQERDGRRSAKKIGGSVAFAGALSSIARITAQVSQFVIFIIAARVLSPEEFGIFALVSAAAIILFRVSQAGWPEFIMSWKGDPAVIEQVFFVALVAGFFAMGLGVLLAAGAGWFAGSAIFYLSLCFAIWVPASTVAAAYQGIMVRSDKLAQTAVTLLLGEATGFAITVWALLAGMGVFALALGRLAQQAVHVGAGAIFTRAVPRTGIPGPILGEVLSFYKQVLSSRVLINVSTNAVTYIIGGFLGAAAVGYFRAAIRLASAVLEVIGEPTRLLAWAVFRRAVHGKEDVRAAIERQANVFYPVVYAVAMPLFLMLAIFAEDLTVGLLGETWAPAASLVAILALAQFLTIPAFVTETVLSITGTVSRLPRASLLVAIVAIVVTLVAAPFGVVAVAWSQIALQAVFFAVHATLQSRHAGVDFRRIAVRCWKAAVLIVALAVPLFLLEQGDFGREMHPLLRAIALSLPFGVAYLAVLYMSDGEIRKLVRTSRAAADGSQ